MIKLIIGFALGCFLVAYYPQVGEVLSQVFVESGMRDDIVEKLKGI